MKNLVFFDFFGLQLFTFQFLHFYSVIGIKEKSFLTVGNIIFKRFHLFYRDFVPHITQRT